MRICSYALQSKKQAKLATTGVLPLQASPPPMLTMLLSAMPTLKPRFGKAWAKTSVRVEFSNVAINCHNFRVHRHQFLERTSPNASRVA